MSTFGFSDLTWGTHFGGDDDDQDEEQDYSTQWRQAPRDGLIFVIDCSESMFEENDSSTPFELCIKCAKNVMQNKIISSEKDLMGLVFFGTDKSKNSGDFKNIYVLQDLDQPGRESVLQLEELSEESADEFTAKYGHGDGFSLSDVFWTCSNMFSKSSQRIGFKRVMLFTNNDNPHSNNPNLQRQAKTKAGDLHENGIDLELMHMQKPGENFDVSLFYKDCLFYDDDETTTALPDPAEKFDELLTRVRSKDHKKRSLGKIPFTFGKDMSMAVGVYSLVRTCTKPYAVKLYKKTNEEVKSVSKTFLADTLEVLMPQDTKKAATYSGKKICFEIDELNEMRRLGEPGLTLMGFKPKSALKRYHHVRPAQFIYPEETVIKGSTNLFTALLQKAHQRDVIPICRYTARKNTPPRFVALLPQEEELDEHNVQVTPPGFHVIFLPFADDLRSLKYEETPRANKDQVEKAKEVVKKMNFPFKSESFENPSLQKHYANLEALALDRDVPDDITDYTMPDDAMISKRAGKILGEFKELVFPDGYEAGKGKKRPAGGAAGPAGKKARGGADDGEIDVEAEARAGRLSKLTVPILKEFVRKTKIKGGGTKKADLMEAINDHFGL
ncbi:X-ray repair cross-complementing protein 6-like [Lineus longissimus]|uniref:X-ray repair cross-complementing protein 6-like n=1 Tax=Lineus longissimus TaxID=88925 RepID=UPI002B4ED1C8